MPMPEEYSHCVCCFVILVDFIFKVCKNYYPQVFVEVCKYEIKKKEFQKKVVMELNTSSKESDQ